MIICGIAIIIAPFGFATAVTSITGAVLLIVGLVLVISQLTENKKKPNSNEVIETEIIDVEEPTEIIDVTDFKDVD